MREASRIGLPRWAVESIIDMFCRVGSQHAIPFRWRPALRDPDDEFLLELAVASRSEFIVTYNIQDFLGIEAFGVRALTPGAFLRTIETWP